MRRNNDHTEVASDERDTSETRLVTKQDGSAMAPKSNVVTSDPNVSGVVECFIVFE